jgi:hypothetical protein
VEEIAFSSSSHSGSVFGLTHSDKHITVIDEENAISSHTTVQDTKKWNHLGRLSKNEMTDKLWLEILKPRKLQDNELDQTMMYFTKKLISVFNMPEDVFFKVTDDKSMSYLDLDAIFEYAYSFFQNLQKSPNAFLGLCSVRQMLSSEDIELGQLENGKFIMRIDKELYEMDLSLLQEALSMQNGSNSKNPMLNILKSLGMISFQESLTERLKELFSKAQQNDK